MLPLASEKRQWFEFLLDDNLLADHLAQSQPGMCYCSSIQALGIEKFQPGKSAVMIVRLRY